VKAFYYGFLKTAGDLIPGGKAEGKPASKYDPEELKKGIKIESEHVHNKAMQREIAKDHLEEKKNSKYYDYLPIAEEQPEAKGLEKKVEKFLKRNPSPTDEEFHELAQRSGANKHKLEASAYSLLGKYLGAKGE
jgi:hypothetical protein